MAKFELIAIEIATIKKGDNQGKKYMAITLMNTLDPLSPSRKMTDFDDGHVKVYSKYVPKKNGGELEADELTLPDNLKYINGCFQTWSPCKENIPFTKMYVTDGTHTVNGNPIQHKNGDTVVDKNGNPRLYDSIRVFCRYYMDPDFPGIPQYAPGCSAAEVGQQYFNNFCNRWVKPATTTQDDEDFGSVPNPQKPAEKTIVGYDANMNPIYAD